MVLRDVAQVVGHAAPDVFRRVIPQRLQDRDDRAWILEEGGNPDRSRQSGSGAFAAQPTHVRIRILRPFHEPCEGPRRPLDEEQAQ